MKKHLLLLVVIIATFSCTHAGKKMPPMHGHGQMKSKIEYDVVKEQDVIDMISKGQAANVPESVSIKDILYGDDYRVVFIGEQHDSYAHHTNQLALIVEMHKRYGKVAIGMEMFQKPFQNVLDRYIAGEISEIEMLKQTEYFERWAYDFTLYKPILDYAKKYQLHIVALNVPAAVTKAIGHNGMDNLTAEDRSMVAAELDMSDEDYRVRLKKIFDQHPGRSEFEHFFQAQLAWDETMAETAAAFVKANSEARLVVLAGNGHIEHGYGIPNRFKRRVDVPTVTIVQDLALQNGIADYVLYPTYVNVKPTPKLGVMLHVEDNRLKVQKVTHGGAAMKAGIQDGDYLLQIGETKLEKVSDLKLMLYGAQESGLLNITVEREGQVLHIAVKL